MPAARMLSDSGLRAGVHSSALLHRAGPFRWVALSGDPKTSTVPMNWRWSCFRTIRAQPGRRAAGRFAVDFDDPHFNGLEGVFVVWQGGSQPAAISVGVGPLRQELKAQRADPAFAPYRGKPLFVAWAKVEKLARAGVARYLYETLKPRTLMSVPTVRPST